MKYTIGYEINEKDMTTVIRHLKTHDHANADRKPTLYPTELPTQTDKPSQILYNRTPSESSNTRPQ